MNSIAKVDFADVSSERSVLTCILQEPELMIEADTKLAESAFLSDHHRELYAILRYLTSQRYASFDYLMVVELAEKRGLLKSVPEGYIRALYSADIDTRNFPIYLKQVSDRSTAYKIIQAAERIQKDVLANVERPAEEQVAVAEARILDISMDVRGDDDPVRLGEGLRERVRQLAENPVKIRGLTTGIPLVDRRLNGLLDGTLTVIGGRLKSGKCLTGDTLILDALSGLMKPISSFTGKVATFEGGVFKPKDIVGPVCSGEKEVFKITMRSGMEIKATDNHPFLSPVEWVDIKSTKLAVGTRLAMPANLPFFGQKSMPKGELGLIAYWLAEGARNRGYISATRASVLEDLRECCARLSIQANDQQDDRDCVRAITVVNGPRSVLIDSLDIKQRIDTGMCKYGVCLKDYATLVGIKYTTLWNIYYRGTCGYDSLRKLIGFDFDTFGATEVLLETLTNRGRKTPLSAILSKYGIDIDSYAWQKSIPNTIFELNKNDLAYFLNRLYSGDGWVSAKEIGYSTTSRSLAQQLHHLLLRFGIFANIHLKDGSYGGKQTRKAYSIVIQKKRYIERFLDRIGVEGRQQEIVELQRLLRDRSDGDVFGNPPREFSNKLIKCVRECGISLETIHKETGVYLRRSQGLSWPRARRVAEFVGDNDLSDLASEDIFWDEVVNIEACGRQKVYDVQVLDGEPNFVANDFIVHNSVMLMNWAAHIAFTLGVPVLMLDTEMSDKEQEMRLLSHLSAVPERFILSGEFTQNPEARERVQTALDLIENGVFYHKYYPGYTVEGLKSIVRKYHALHGIGTFFFDYIKTPETMSSNLMKEYQLLGNITQGLKDLAGMLKIPVVAGAQMKRGDSGTPKSLYNKDDFADSDRILRYANSGLALAMKSQKEYEEEGKQCGTHRLQILAARGGGETYHGVDLDCHFPTLTIRQAGAQANGMHVGFDQE